MEGFGRLPVEMCFMVFDHFVTDPEALAHSCLVSYEWRRIIQDSYVWRFLVVAKLGRYNALKYLRCAGLRLSALREYQSDPLYDESPEIVGGNAQHNPLFWISFAMKKEMNPTFKETVFKRYMFTLDWNLRTNVSFMHCNLLRVLQRTGYIRGIKYFEGCSYFFFDDLSENDVWSLFYNACTRGCYSAAKWMYGRCLFLREKPKGEWKEKLYHMFMTVCSRGYTIVAE